MKSDFFDVPLTDYTISTGVVQLPVFYQRLAMRAINYFVDYDRVLPILKGTGLLPVRFFNRKVLATLTFFNYQEVSLTAYDEVVLSVSVYPEALGKPSMPTFKLLFAKNEKSWKNMGVYVVEMPVTIPEARAGGREIWGYPKFLTQITSEVSPERFRFAVLDPETQEPIVDVKAEVGRGFSAKPFAMITFGNFQDKILRTVVDADGRVRHCRCKGVEVKVADTKHRMAENIRALGLDTAKPFSIMTSDYLRTKLNPGKPVADWKSPALPYQYEAELEFYRRQREPSEERT
jgi:Acetoacetate decarboxylase (ADC)